MGLSVSQQQQDFCGSMKEEEEVFVMMKVSVDLIAALEGGFFLRKGRRRR